MKTTPSTSLSLPNLHPPFVLTRCGNFPSTERNPNSQSFYDLSPFPPTPIRSGGREKKAGDSPRGASCKTITFSLHLRSGTLQPPHHAKHHPH